MLDKHYNLRLTDEYIIKLFKEADFDYSKGISYDEFLASFAGEHHVPRVPPRMPAGGPRRLSCGLFRPRAAEVAHLWAVLHAHGSRTAAQLMMVVVVMVSYTRAWVTIDLCRTACAGTASTRFIPEFLKPQSLRCSTLKASIASLRPFGNFFSNTVDDVSNANVSVLSFTGAVGGPARARAGRDAPVAQHARRWARARGLCCWGAMLRAALVLLSLVLCPTRALPASAVRRHGP